MTEQIRVEAMDYGGAAWRVLDHRNGLRSGRVDRIYHR